MDSSSLRKDLCDNLEDFVFLDPAPPPARFLLYKDRISQGDSKQERKPVMYGYNFLFSISLSTW